MAFREDDALRSIRRYVSLALPGYRLRLERREISNDQRPTALIEMGDAVIVRSRAGNFQQGDVTQQAPVTVTLFPQSSADGREGSLTARRDLALLRDAFLLGLVDGSTSIGAPFRVPMFDWKDVPAAGTTRGDAGSLTGYLYLAEDLSGRVIQDPQDLSLFSVSLTLTASWDRPGRIPIDDGPIVQTMPPIGEWEGYYAGGGEFRPVPVRELLDLAPATAHASASAVVTAP